MVHSPLGPFELVQTIVVVWNAIVPLLSISFEGERKQVASVPRKTRNIRSPRLTISSVTLVHLHVPTTTTQVNSVNISASSILNI